MEKLARIGNSGMSVFVGPIVEKTQRKRCWLTAYIIFGMVGVALELEQWTFHARHRARNILNFS